MVEDAPPINGEQLIECFVGIWEAGAAQTVESLAPIIGRTPTPDQFETLTWALYEADKGHRRSVPERRHHPPTDVRPVASFTGCRTSTPGSPQPSASPRWPGS